MMLGSDESSFEQLFEKYWERLYNICFHYLLDSDIAAELVQDIFRSIWERRDTLLVKTSMENYLVRAARLKAFEHLRNVSIQKRNFEEVGYLSVGSDNYTENQVYYDALSEKVSNVVSELPPQCQKVYRLSREQGMNNRQIALSLDISEKTVENQITRALRVLRTELAAYLE